MGSMRKSREEMRGESDSWSERDCVRWVAQNIENDRFDRIQRCPDVVNPIAFNMLKWVRGVNEDGSKGPSRRDDFWRGMYMRMVGTRLDQDDEVKRDTGKMQFDLIDKLLREYEKC